MTGDAADGRAHAATRVRVLLGFVVAVLISVIAACKHPSSVPEAVEAGCSAVHPTTDGGTCPIMPVGGVACSVGGDCGGQTCAAGVGCCVQVVRSNTVCFPACSVGGQCPPASSVCVPQGACQTASDCQGVLPHVCEGCPLSRDGTASQGCAHWTCAAGRCDVAYCEPGMVCAGGRGCPAYFMAQMVRSCSADTDCVVVTHQEGCCRYRAIGIPSTEYARFDAAEQECGTTRDCTAFPCEIAPVFAVEDGAAYGNPQTLAASCSAGTCKAVVVAGPVPCGNQTCAVGDACCMSTDENGFCVPACMTACLDAGAETDATACRVK